MYCLTKFCCYNQITTTLYCPYIFSFFANDNIVTNIQKHAILNFKNKFDVLYAPSYCQVNTIKDLLLLPRNISHLPSHRQKYLFISNRLLLILIYDNMILYMRMEKIHELDFIDSIVCERIKNCLSSNK